MKIEVDLNDIFGDEGETLEESVRRQVVEKVSESVQKGIKHQIEEQTIALMNQELRVALKDKIPALLDDLMNAEYQPIDTYGQKGKPTSFRSALIQAVAKECTYQPKQSHYDQNEFTKTIKAMIDAQMTAFKKEFDATINEQFRRDAITYAVTELSKRLGLPAKV